MEPRYNTNGNSSTAANKGFVSSDSEPEGPHSSDAVSKVSDDENENDNDNDKDNTMMLTQNNFKKNKTSNNNGTNGNNTNGDNTAAAATAAATATAAAAAAAAASIVQVLANELNSMSIMERKQILQVIDEQAGTQDAISFDKPLARELNELTMDERESVLHDIHGISDASVVETPALLSSCMLEMDAVLHHERIQNGNSITKAFDQAEQQNRAYVQDPTFRLLFLRAESFHAKNATLRMLKFFQHKLELFGPNKLCQDIQMKDLSPDDLESLQTGYMQLGQARDQAGRAILIYMSCFMKGKTHENMSRAQFYHIMLALQDPETQKKGLVFVLYRVGGSRFPQPNPWMIWKNARQFTCMPIRIRGWHLCAIDFNSIWATRWFLEKNTRVRTRMHLGSPTECKYHLMTFGIPVDNWPVVHDMELSKDRHLEWIQTQKRIENNNHMISKQQPSEPPQPNNNNGNGNGHQKRNITSSNNQKTSQSPVPLASADATTSGLAISDHHDNNIVSGRGASMPVLIPSRSDILFGRGKPIQEHAGNLRLGILLESTFPRYEALKRHDKTAFAQEVVLKIKSMGGRFLKQTEGMWMEVSDDKAREKVSHTFRSMRSEFNKSKQQKSKTKSGGSSNNKNCNGNGSKTKKIHRPLEDIMSDDVASDKKNRDFKKRSRTS